MRPQPAVVANGRQPARRITPTPLAANNTAIVPAANTAANTAIVPAINAAVVAALQKPMTHAQAHARLQKIDQRLANMYARVRTPVALNAGQKVRYILNVLQNAGRLTTNNAQRMAQINTNAALGFTGEYETLLPNTALTAGGAKVLRNNAAAAAAATKHLSKPAKFYSKKQMSAWAEPEVNTETGTVLPNHFAGEEKTKLEKKRRKQTIAYKKKRSSQEG